ncbi:MAG: hypothetical protein DI551_12130 [Micavibrio aeruginosavorus]|uniref:Serine/threonine protein phosphatase n=1 Tax=Micavibrio aeruginosavorus TaxID=349221 RepID=A0A2W5MTC7_9BACT|nr:MAG: hypothetical protein DI551_12130 [Micavibrio aeruginosavorus]
MDYHAFGHSLIPSSPHTRTMCGELDGRKIWIKLPVPPKARIWHHLQRILASALGKPILRYTVSPGGGESLYKEADRLCAFKESGFHVPDVLGVYDDMMVLSDAGPQLRETLDKTKDLQTRTALLKTAMLEMARLHAKGLAHGRPYMRDMTWDGTRIGFLDLEEDPVRVMPLSTAQARDIWIFLSAASRFSRVPGDKLRYEGPLISDLLTTYREQADPKTMQELNNLVHFLKPVRKMLDRSWLWGKIGTDARQSVYVNRCLERDLGSSSAS